MSDEEINAAIGRHVHANLISVDDGGGPGASYHKEWPRYTSDLNAMHEAEKAHGFHDLKYVRLLTWVCDHDWQHATTKTHRNPIYATARQRAEAFLRTIGKWKD